MKATYEWMSEIAEAAQNYISLKQQTGVNPVLIFPTITV